MEVTAIHYLGMILVVGITLGYSIYSARSVKSAAGFSLVGRAASSPLVAGGIVGVIIGGGATVGTAQLAYQAGLCAWSYSLGAGLGFLVQGIFYARALRRTNLETVPEFFGLHYGRYAAPVISVCGTLSMLCGCVAGVIAGINILAAILKIPHLAATFLLAVLVLMTVFFSGQKGSSVTGIIKMGVLWIGLLVGSIVALVALYDLPNFSEAFPKDPWLNLFSTGKGQVLGNIFSTVVGICCSQNYIQALYSASDARTASRGAIMAACVVIPVGLPIVAIGMLMHAKHPELQPILALPTFFFTYLPDWFGGIAISGVLLAIIGSTAGQALGIGTMISRDFVGNLFKISSSESILRANRTTLVAVTIIFSTLAYIYLNSTVLYWNFFSFLLRGGGVFVPLTLAIFKPGWLSPPWALASIIISTTVAIVAKLVFNVSQPLFLALGISLIIVLLGIVLSGKSYRAHYLSTLPVQDKQA